MNDVSNRAVREFSEFLNSIEADFPKPTCTTAYEITMKSTIVSALITLDTEKQMDERFWNHLRVQDARETLQLANSYMGELGKGIHELTTIKLSDRKVQEFINEFFPITEDLTDGQRKNNLRLQEDLKARYYNAPDLEWVGKNGWRFVNAVSDFATHADPIRKTRNYNENLFLRTAEGNPMIDKAYKMVLSAA